MKRSTGLLAVWLFISFTGAFSGHIFAQGVQTGTIRGAVVDEHGLPVPGVAVTIYSSALQGQPSVSTSADGSYAFRALPPGDYDIRFQMGSFAPLARSIAVPIGETVEENATLLAAGVTETVTVVADMPVGLNITQDEVEVLATPRTLQGIATLSPGLTENAPNAGQVVISGAFAFDNIFMVNGVDVTDNLFGAPQSLFIEDAIQETAVLTSGITAEYGRFSGGVVNAITKSGGNIFAGSYRVNLSNPAWALETPFDVENGIVYPNALNTSHEMTVGGPLVEDRLWFFGAGRLARVDAAGTLNQTGLPYIHTDKNTRGEIKVTATAAATHMFQAGYLTNHMNQTNRPSFAFSIDPFALSHQTQPNWYAFVNYRGAPHDTLLAEAQYSERRFAFHGTGGTSAAMVDSPMFTLSQDLGQYNAPYFDASDPEERNSRQVTGSLTYFANRGGWHELKNGVEWFRSQNIGGGSQSATGYVFDADYAVDPAGKPLFDSGGYLMPIFSPGRALAENWLADRGAVLNVDTRSLYAQDHWRMSRRASADVGIRYERVRSQTTGGTVGVDADTVVPRLALAYDVHGNGRLVVGATYGHYAGRYDKLQIGANSGVGNPDRTLGVYVGPTGQGRAFAPGFDPANYQTFVGYFPTANIRFDDSLSSPVTKEFTLSGGTSIGSRGYGRATYVWRRTTNVIEDFIDLSNGITSVVRNGVNVGNLTTVVYRNSSIPQRRYQSLMMQARFRPSRNWEVSGFWTVQLRNEGNYEGEAANLPGMTSAIGDFPEAFDPARNEPFGRLRAFERHRGRLWSVYRLGLGRVGDLSLSGLIRLESGQVYSVVAKGVPLSSIQEERLADYPTDARRRLQKVYFGARGSQTFPGYAVVDASVTCNLRLFGPLKPWVKLDIFNLLNNNKLIGSNTTVVPDPDSRMDSLGLPTGYMKGPDFGLAQSSLNFPSSLGLGGGRTFRVALGVRFR